MKKCIYIDVHIRGGVFYKCQLIKQLTLDKCFVNHKFIPKFIPDKEIIKVNSFNDIDNSFNYDNLVELTKNKCKLELITKLYKTTENNCKRIFRKNKLGRLSKQKIELKDLKHIDKRLCVDIMTHLKTGNVDINYIAKQFNVSKQIINQIIDFYKVDMNGIYSKNDVKHVIKSRSNNIRTRMFISDELKRSIIEFLNVNSFNVELAANYFNLSASNIYKIRRENCNIDKRNFNKYDEETVNKVFELMKKYNDTDTVAKKLNLKNHNIYYILKQKRI